MRQLEARLTVEEGASVSKVFRVLKFAVTAVATEVLGYKSLRDQGKGRVW